MEINSKQILKSWEEDLKNEIKKLKQKPILHIIVAKDYSQASTIYVKNKIKKAAEIGIETVCSSIEWQGKTKLDLRNEITRVITSTFADGVIIQDPFPFFTREHISIMIEEFAGYEKDVDGFTSMQKGKLISGDKDTLVPCTAKGIMKIIEGQYLEKYLNGLHMLIINRSDLIGKPLTQLALQKNMTVSIAHSKTYPEDLENLFKNADIIVTGCGKRKIFDSSDLPKNKEQVIIDCSMNKKEGIAGVGDFDKDDVFKNRPNIDIASGYGHTGPATILALMENTLQAYKNNKKS